MCEGELSIKAGRKRNGKEKLKNKLWHSQFACLLVPAWVTQTTTGKTQDAKQKMQSDSQAGHTNWSKIQTQALPGNLLHQRHSLQHTASWKKPSVICKSSRIKATSSKGSCCKFQITQQRSSAGLALLLNPNSQGGCTWLGTRGTVLCATSPPMNVLLFDRGKDKNVKLPSQRCSPGALTDKSRQDSVQQPLPAPCLLILPLPLAALPSPGARLGARRKQAMWLPTLHKQELAASRPTFH